MHRAEVLQWIAIALTALVAVAVLLRLLQLHSPVPPAGCAGGPVRGARLPEAALRRLGPFLRPPGLAVAFIREGCVPCARLLESLADPRNRPLLDRVVLVAYEPSRGFLARIRELGVRVLPDAGRLWAECAVADTPLLVWVDGSGSVRETGVTDRIDRFVRRMQEGSGNGLDSRPAGAASWSRDARSRG